MSRLRLPTIGLALAATITVAHAEPCANEIDRLVTAEARLNTQMLGGPTAPQSIGAQLGHQPTPSSVESARQEAQSRFSSTLARARELAAEGKSAECMEAVTNARRMLVD